MAGASPRRRARRADPDLPPFSAFLDRDAVRQQRDRKRHRILVVSLVLHAVLVVALLVYSFWDVGELFGPSVEVRVFSPAKLPQEAAHLKDPSLRELSELTDRSFSAVRNILDRRGVRHRGSGAPVIPEPGT